MGPLCVIVGSSLGPRWVIRWSSVRPLWVLVGPSVGHLWVLCVSSLGLRWVLVGSSVRPLLVFVRSSVGPRYFLGASSFGSVCHLCVLIGSSVGHLWAPRASNQSIQTNQLMLAFSRHAQMDWEHVCFALAGQLHQRELDVFHRRALNATAP